MLQLLPWRSMTGSVDGGEVETESFSRVPMLCSLLRSLFLPKSHFELCSSLPFLSWQLRLPFPLLSLTPSLLLIVYFGVPKRTFSLCRSLRDPPLSDWKGLLFCAPFPYSWRWLFIYLFTHRDRLTFHTVAITVGTVSKQDEHLCPPGAGGLVAGKRYGCKKRCYSGWDSSKYSGSMSNQMKRVQEGVRFRRK